MWIGTMENIGRWPRVSLVHRGLLSGGTALEPGTSSPQIAGSGGSIFAGTSPVNRTRAPGLRKSMFPAVCRFWQTQPTTVWLVITGRCVGPNSETHEGIENEST